VSALGFLVVSPAVSTETFTKPTIAIAAAKAGAIGIIDAEVDAAAQAEAFAYLAQHAGGGTIGIRMTGGASPRPYAIDNLQWLAADAGRKVVVLTASTGSFVEKTLRADVAKLKSLGFEVFVEAINVAEAQLAGDCGADAVIAKGHESGGRVGDTTSFVLMQQFARDVRLPVWVQGGVGLNSAAAFELAGAIGVVLDSQLWLTRESQIAPELKLRVERMDGSETALTATEGDASYRRVDGVAAGQDTCFARSLAVAGGTVSGVIHAIKEAAAEQRAVAAKVPVLSEGSELAMSHNTRYPVVQGAMTRVSDTSEFALKVAEGGGLPFLALSLMRGKDIEVLLQETKEKLGDRPWGVGLLGFVPTELREEQMQVVDRFHPPFALIAGGRPDQAKALEGAGTKTYLHVPSPLLLKSFIEMGSRRFIFEGKECGGHVGPRSSMVLWQSMIDVMLESIRPKDNPSTFHVLFAGGIHDDLSAAMVATLAAPLTARGIKVGVLLGTAYLFTEEAVASGAIVKKFQDEALKCNDTVLLETGPGHSIRCIASPYKQAFDSHRDELQKANKSRDEIREELELMNLGRLRIASKGLAKQGGGLAQIPAEQQWQEGMYMIGQVASLHDKVITIESLHKNVCADGQARLQAAGTTNDTVSEATAGEPIAIVGMSCQFPLANDVEMFWQNILNRVDAIDEIPQSHFDWRNFYNPDPLAPDTIVSKWGGFLQDVTFDPSRYGIPPSSLDSIDPMQVLVLEAARLALEDAGYGDRKFPRQKTSVLLANAGHGPITALYSLRSMLGWKLDHLPEESKQRILAEMPEWTEDSFPGYLGNVVAGRVANRLDLKGINFSIDAACASSLAALYVGINDLRSGASDVVLLGATDTHNQPGDFLSFSKTHALSKDGRCKTFDASADGIVISEGIAMLVLKRLSDAERDGDRIYAVIRGIGGSSDGRDLSLTAPRPAGQELALKRAYADAGVSPASVSLIEAHGTGTVAGDKAEVEALTKVFTESGASVEQCAIGSVKTNIGHTKAAAGLASLVKIAKALHHKILPPTINVKKPNPACKFGEGPFYLNTEARPWQQPEGTPRRAGVSAFGFGGTNFHTILEEYVSPTVVDETPAVAAWPAELFVWKASNPQQLLKMVAATEAAVTAAKAERNKASLCDSSERRALYDLAAKLHQKLHDDSNSESVLAIVAGSLDTLAQKIANFKAHAHNGGALDKDIRYAPKVAREKVAFLFPGQGSQRINMLRELSLFFPELQRSISEVDSLTAGKFAKPLSNFIYPAPALTEDGKRNQQVELTQTEIAQPALGACDVAVLRLMNGLGVTPDMVAGHSYGEYVALHAAGVLSISDLMELSVQRGRILASCGAENPGAMAAVSADVVGVKAAIADIEGVYLANINTPSQCIISGTTDGIERALTKLKSMGVAATKIPVSAAFHTPLMNASTKPLAKALSAAKFNSPRLSVWSNTTAVEHKAESIREQLSKHALEPVRFAEQLVNMHDAGVRLFVEVGPGNVLTGLVENTLKGRPFQAANLEAQRQPLENFLHVLAALAANGTPINFRKLFWNRRPQLVSTADAQPVEPKKNQLLYRVNSVRMERMDKPKTDVQQSPTKPQTAKPAAQLPATTTAPKSAALVPKRAGGTETERVMLEFQQSMLQMTNRFLETQQNVMLAYLQSNGKLPEGFALPAPTMQQPNFQLPEVHHNGNGNGNSNGHASGNGNGNGNGHAPIAAPPVVQPVVEAEPEAPKQTAEQQAASLVDSLYEIVSERTGYPREMLDPELDLEADLGIDSIKRVEILNNFRKLLPESVQEQLESGIEKLAGTKTLQGVIDWINSLDLDGSSTATSTASTQSATDLRSAGACAVAAKNLNGDINKIARGVVTTKKVDAAKSTKEIAKNILVIGTELEAALKKGLKGHNVTFVDRNASAYFAAVKNAPEDVAVIATTRLGGDFGLTDTEHLNLDELTQHAAVVGLTKTVAKEYPERQVKVLDFEPKASADAVAKAVLSELRADDAIVEVGFKGGDRLTVEVTESSYDDIAPEATPPISSSSVVLVTGGGRGITGEIALDIARRYKPTFIVVGRLAKPSDKESNVTAGLTAPKDVKAALIEELKKAGGTPQLRDVEKAFQQLLRERQVREQLQALEATGAKVRYYSVDVSDEAAFGRLIDSIYETSNIDGVIHGAGIIEDALIKDKTQESFDRVVNTKIKSALTLANKLQFDSLKFLFLFSSVVGRTGNAGQADYVAANEAVNKLAARLSKTNGTARIASLMWGPWQAGMAPPELEQVFARHGWSMIQPEDGRECFHEEVLRRVSQPEVLLVGRLPNVNPNDGELKAKGALIHRGTAVRTGANSASFTVNVVTNEHIYLKDHQFDGVPVMPMAVALEMMLESTRSYAPDKHIVAVRNMDIPAGIVFHTGKKELAVDAQFDAEEANVLHLSLNATLPSPKTHFRCKAELGDAPNAVRAGNYVSASGTNIPVLFNAKELPESDRDIPDARGTYGKWLFHGKIFQGMQKIIAIRPDGICGEVLGSRSREFVTTADDSPWIVDPVLLDSAMQLAGVWARHYKDVTVLPAGFKSLRVLKPVGYAPVKARIFLTETLATELQCDLAIYDEHDSLAIVVEGLGGIASKSFNRFAAQTPVKELV
jgi:acyl transferase domain-containing protein/NAD(P)H-dependent flavin oxidoreductase YrpB (nitropropane dioxygenase family)